MPIRLRVAAAFAVAMAIVLAATGVYVYTSLEFHLDRSLNQDLRLRAQDLSALVSEPGASLGTESGGRLIERGESFAELLGADGTVIDATPSLDRRPLLARAGIAAALRGPRFLDRPSAPGLDEPARLLAIPVGRANGRVVLVVGATRENGAEALRRLRTDLLLAGPAALVVATLLGYALAGAGLRAVDAMRKRAAEISADRPGERIPVPAARDELGRLGETLNEMLDRLEAALARERDFVADAGHELRTPLALLRAELDFALEHASDEAELRTALREASAETDWLVQLAAGLLMLAGSDRGGLPLRRERVTASELLESVRNRFARRAQDEGRSLTVAAPDGLALDGDRHRLEQALGAMVDNALRHGRGAVRVELRPRGPLLELAVTDEGPGFPEPFLARAFERFSRPDGGRAGDGAGLGLAIAGAIAEAHGGRARGANRPAGGAEVTIELSADRG